MWHAFRRHDGGVVGADFVVLSAKCVPSPSATKHITYPQFKASEANTVVRSMEVICRLQGTSWTAGTDRHCCCWP